MEEILASIRRIIADDDALPSARRRTRDVAEQGLAAEPAAPASSAYSEPALERYDPPSDDDAQGGFHEDFAEVEAPEPPPAVEIAPLRFSRQAEPAVSHYETAAPAQPDVAPPPALDEAFEPTSGASGASDALLSIDVDAPLVSPDAASSIAAHFQTLAASMVINDSGLLQKYAQEMMRPMLKQWLDDNLPVIVERLVRAEIERVARGGRR